MAIRRILVVLGSTLPVQVGGLLTVVITARLLGPEGRGILAQLLSWALVLASLGGLSLFEEVIYQTAQRHDGDAPLDAVRAGLAVAAMTSLFTLAIGAATIPWTFDIGAKTTLVAVLIAAMIIPANQISMVIAAYFQATSLGRIWTAMRLVAPVTALAAMAIFAEIGGALPPVLFLLPQIVGSVLVIGIGLWYMRGLGMAARLPHGAEMSSLLRYSWRVHASALGAQREHWDRLIVSYCISAFAMGQYAVASTLPAALMALAVTLDMMLFPHFARRGATIEEFMQPARVAIYIVILGGATIAAASWLLIPTIFGNDHIPAVGTAIVMSMTYTVIAIRYIIGGGFKAMDMPFRHGRGDLIAFAATFALLLPAAIYYGAVGAAIAALTIQVIVLGIGLHAFQSQFGQAWWKLFFLSRRDAAMVIGQLRTLRLR